MPEEIEVPVERAQEIIDERRELKEMAEELRPKWLDSLALSTALFAVLAAIAALQAGDKANEALLLANRAVLIQTQAVDTWMQFQADSVKKGQATSLATILGKVGATPQEMAQVRAAASARQQQQDELQREAKARDTEADALVRESQATLATHQRFALAVTLFQIAIGLSAIAALLKLQPVWWVSLLAGGWAAVVLAATFLQSR